MYKNRAEPIAIMIVVRRDRSLRVNIAGETDLDFENNRVLGELIEPALEHLRALLGQVVESKLETNLGLA